MGHSAELKSSIIELLKTQPVCVPNSMDTQWVTRCHFCGDSHDPSHGHFSIKIDVDDDESPMLYRCFKCDESGMLTPDVLDMMGLSLDDATSKQLKSYNRKSSKTNAYVNRSGVARYRVPVFSKSQLHDQKLGYISARLGIPLTYEMAQTFNIVLDIFEFMKYNEIDAIPHASINLLQFLNSNYVGFLSSNRNQIVNRACVARADIRRYHKLILDPKNQNMDKYYNIASALDPLYTEDIDIHIAEGIFDILSIKMNLAHDDTKPALFYASCGFNYSAVLKYLIYNGVNTGLSVHIYSDNDKQDYDHEKYLIYSNIGMWLDHIHIHRNQSPGEKDYGVESIRIVDSAYRIK